MNSQKPQKPHPMKVAFQQAARQLAAGEAARQLANAESLEPHRRTRSWDNNWGLFRALGPAAVCVVCVVLLTTYMAVGCLSESESASWPEGSAPVATPGDKSYLNEEAPHPRYGIRSLQGFMRAATPSKEAEAEPTPRGPFSNANVTCPVPGSGSCEATIPLPIAPPYAGGYGGDDDGGRRLFKGLFRKLLDKIKHRGPLRERFGGGLQGREGGLLRGLFGKLRAKVGR